MKNLLLITIIFLSSVFSIAQEIPRIGSNNQLEVCNWNVEWFGKNNFGFGPSNKYLQKRNVANVISKTQMDVLALQEVASSVMFDSLLMALPDYHGILAPYSAELKTAFLYKNSHFKLAYHKVLATNSDSFSTGRYPFELALVPLNSFLMDTLFLINIHLKANTGTDSEKQEAYFSRKKSIDWLRNYLFNQRDSKSIIVLGDWNDDFDESIYKQWPSPIAKLELQSNSSYFFLTKSLTENNIPSTTSYTDFIDHQLISSSLNRNLPNQQTSILDLRNLVQDYSNTTTDHYPVYTVFNDFFIGLNDFPIKNSEKICPNPASSWFSFPDNIRNIKVTIYDVTGRNLIQEKEIFGDDKFEIDLLNGVYWIKIESSSRMYYQKLMVQN